MFFLSKNSYIYSTLYINLVIFSEKKREKLLKSSEIARKYVIILLLKGRVNMANTKIIHQRKILLKRRQQIQGLKRVVLQKRQLLLQRRLIHQRRLLLLKMQM